LVAYIIDTSGEQRRRRGRIHDSLEKDAPNHRPIEPKPSPTATVISKPRLGGLHHRYSWREAA
jgi:hypothetical protein